MQLREGIIEWNRSWKEHKVTSRLLKIKLCVEYLWERNLEKSKSINSKGSTVDFKNYQS